MTDNTGSEDPNKLNNQESNAGTDPKKPSSDANTNNGKPKDGEDTFDESVFDNPKLWTHPRFKSLNERAKKADELERAMKDANESKLAESKKFEELATLRANERDEAVSKYKSSLQDNKIITEASKIGVVDIEAVLRLVDRSSITIDDNGNVNGAAEAVQALLSTKAYLKGKSNVTIGSPTNPGSDGANQPKKFTLSQIQDTTFYREHEKEILEAYRTGNIEDDRQ